MSKHGPITAAPMTWAECAAAGMTRVEAAAHHGLSERTAFKRQKELGLKFKPRMVNPLGGVTREVLEPIWARKNISIAKIAKTLGVSPSSILQKAIRLGLPQRTNTRHPIDEKLFAEMWKLGVNSAELQRHFGYGSSSMPIKTARRLGLKPRTTASRANSITAAAAIEAIMVREMKASAEKSKVAARRRAEKIRA